MSTAKAAAAKGRPQHTQAVQRASFVLLTITHLFGCAAHQVHCPYTCRLIRTSRCSTLSWHLQSLLHGCTSDCWPSTREMRGSSLRRPQDRPLTGTGLGVWAGCKSSKITSAFMKTLIRAVMMFTCAGLVVQRLAKRQPAPQPRSASVRMRRKRRKRRSCWEGDHFTEGPLAAHDTIKS